MSIALGFSSTEPGPTTNRREVLRHACEAVPRHLREVINADGGVTCLCFGHTAIDVSYVLIDCNVRKVMFVMQANPYRCI